MTCRTLKFRFLGILGGSWVVISGVKSKVLKVTILITRIRGLITPLITTHKSPFRVKGLKRFVQA